MWEVGFILCNAFSQIEKDDDLVETILVRLVMQSFLSSHGMLAIRIPNSPMVRKKRRCKLCVSTMNWK
jgi:hypothetical protein